MIIAKKVKLMLKTVVFKSMGDITITTSTSDKPFMVKDDLTSKQMAIK